MKNLFSRKLIIILVILIIALIFTAAIWGWRQFNQTLTHGQLADHLARAEEARQASDLNSAFEHLTAAAELDPTNLDYIAQMGDIAFLNGDYTLANNLYQQAGLYNTAESVYRQVLIALSEKKFTEAELKLAGLSSSLSEDRPLTQARVDHLAEKFQQINAETNPPRQEALIGKLLIEENALNLAHTVLVSLTENQPNYRDAHYLLGINYLKQGEIQSARAAWEKALSIDPNYTPAQELIEKYSIEVGP